MKKYFAHLQAYGTQTPSNMKDHCSITSQHSTKITQKRKFTHEENEEQQQTLTLKNQFIVECSSSSSSKSFKSTQSNSSYDTKNKFRRKDSTSNNAFRNWSYATNDFSVFKGTLCRHVLKWLTSAVLLIVLLLDYNESIYGWKDLENRFILASYNILGVHNASKHSHLYPKVPYKYMKWGHRREAICKELAQYDPSILCFQEVDCFSDLRNALRQDGFEGVLKARTGDAQDGCAIFWKHDRFSLLHKENIEFQKFGLRNNVAQFCVLKMNDGQLNPDLNMSKPTLVIGNTHILFNPNRGDIKLGQVRMFLERAHSLSEKWGRIPVVLAGDFNSVPQSAVYQYISSAKLNVRQHDRRRVCGQVEMPLHHSSVIKESFRKKSFMHRWNDEELKNASGSEMVSCLQHELKLRSAYLCVPGTITTRDNTGEPLATSFHSKFMGTVDYIWYNDQLAPIRVLETLSRNELGRIGGLPSKDWGSDHLAVVCEFGFANSEVGRLP